MRNYLIHKERRTPHKVTRNNGDAAMLLLLRRPLWDAVTFCAFDKVRKRDGSRELPPATKNVLRTEGKIGAQMGKKDSL